MGVLPLNLCRARLPCFKVRLPRAALCFLLALSSRDKLFMPQMVAKNLVEEKIFAYRATAAGRPIRTQPVQSIQVPS